MAVGHFEWPLLLGSAAAVVPASLLGAKVMGEHLKDRWIKLGFGILLVGVAARMAWGFWMG